VKRVYQAFLEMERAAYSDGALSKKQKELIAIGISVATDCESFMQWHIDQAAAAGASESEVLEAGDLPAIDGWYDHRWREYRTTTGRRQYWRPNHRGRHNECRWTDKRHGGSNECWRSHG
jgi:AhpD family alkylhydroperoxidase